LTPTITPTPTITLTPSLTPTFNVVAITPASGPASGNTAVLVTGAYFQDGATLAIGGIPANGVQFLSSQQIAAYTPELQPGTLSGVSVINPDLVEATLTNGWLADFLDVPQSDPFHSYLEKIVRHGISSGCGGGNYCPSSPVRRDQMAVFLLKAEHGSTYQPPACTGIFADVYCPSQFADWIEELYAEGITGGCYPRPLLYCPSNPVIRAHMAVFLLRTQHGSTYQPPACTGIFADVPCGYSPFADWVEQLYNEGITSGCQASPLLYCPDSAVSRGQMAVFLVRTFVLP
jgi:hypothetical protein